MLLVNQIIPFSNVDGDGNRCSIFLQGCNIHCIYCHNSETINICNHCGICVEGCPSGALQIMDDEVLYDAVRCIQCDRCINVCPRNATPKAKAYSTEALVAIIESYRPYIRGITVSGGEPTMQIEGIVELFKSVASMGLTRYIDTNGFKDLSGEEELLSNTDGFLFDVKALNHQEMLCNARSENVLSNLSLLAERSLLAEVRTVVFDGYVDVEDVIMEVALRLGSKSQVPYRLIKGHLTGLKGVETDRLKSSVPSDKRMQELKNLALEAGLTNVRLT